MATTVAANYGAFWRVYGTTAHIAQWMSNNKIDKEMVVASVWDDTNQIWEMIVRGNGFTLSV